MSDRWWQELVDDKTIAIIVLGIITIISLVALGAEGKEVALACAGGIGGCAVGKK